MTEIEYIIATNRVKISIMLHLLRDILPGNDCGISDKEESELAKLLSKIESRLFKMIDLNES